MRSHILTSIPRRTFLAGGAALGAAALAACSGTRGVGPSDSGASAAPEGGVQGSRTGKELQIYLSAGHDYQPYLDVIAAFEEENNITVTIQTFQWGDLQQKITADFLSGETPDLVEEPGGFWSTRWGQDGNIMALDDFIAEEEGFLDDFVESGVALRQADGKTYGIPLHVTMNGLVFANQDMLDSAGVAMPTTWEEFKAAAQAIKDSGVEFGCALNNDSSYGRPWYLQNGVTWSGEGEEPIGPAAALTEALNFQKDIIYTDGLAPVPVASNEYSAPRKVFTTGRAGFIITGPWDISPIMTEDPNFPLAIGMPLQGANGQTTTIAGSGLMIPSRSQNAKLAWELIKALTEVSVQEEITKTVGMACSRKSWADSETVKNDPNLVVVAAAREVATAPDRAFWNSTNAAKISDAEKVMYEDVILNGNDAAAAVETLNNTVKPLIEG